MKAALFAYSRRGLRTAAKAAGYLKDCEICLYAPPGYCEGEWQPIRQPSSDFYGELFAWADVLVFVGAMGIAVRSIAPFVKDKQTDPAVLCMDELGNYVISVLSGHIGGANKLASELAEKMDATAVITTATDINHRFSVDAWAAQNQMKIADIRIAKDISAAVLERDVCLYSDFPVRGTPPAGLREADKGDIGICISWYKKEPFTRTLRLIPQRIHLGIGCRKGTGREQIEDAVDQVLKKHNIDPLALTGVYSIDLKANEQGLLEYCEGKGLKPHFYTAEQLLSLPGTFAQSAFVRSVTGVDNVCERASMMEADYLLVGKTVVNAVTVALAAENTEVRFE